MGQKLIIFICILSIFISPVYGEEEEPLFLESADKFEYLKIKSEGSEVISVEGKVRLRYKEMKLSAEKMEINLKTKDLFAQGDVSYIKGKEKIYGEKMTYNLDTERGVFEKTRAVLEEVFHKSKRVEKLSEKEIRMERGSLTTCDLENPHYYLRARKIFVYLEDKLVAKHVFFYVRKIPLFYLPVYIVSLKEDVVSRFAPQVGYSKEEGWFVKTVYGYFFNNSLYGDLYLDWMEKRGWGKGFDSRYRLGEKGNGILYLYYINEKGIEYDPQKDDYYNPPDAPRTKRWKARLKHRQEVSRDTTSLLHLYFLSDEKFTKDYSEDIRDRLRRELESYFTLTRTKPNYNLRLLISKKEDLVEREAKKLERVPELSYRLNPQRIGRSPFFYKVNASFVNFHQPREDIYVLRGDTGFSLRSRSLPLIRRTRLTPEIGYRQTWYKETGAEEEVSRGAYRANLRVDTRLTRYIRNEISYKFGRQIDEDLAAPFRFDRVDSSQNWNEIEETLRMRARGIDLRLSGGYDFDSKEEEGGKNFKNLRTYMTIFPGSGVKFHMSTDYNIYDEEFKRISADFEMRRRGLVEQFRIGTKYYNGGEEFFDLTNQLDLKLGRKWKLDFSARFDLNEGEFKERDYLLWRDLHCWEARLVFREMRGEFLLGLNIKAFPQAVIKFYHNFFDRSWSFMEDDNLLR
jgi:LPS-assembly protein